MADKKNLCAQIDIALHNRVTEEKDRLEKTTSQYVAALLTEYYKMKDEKGVRSFLLAAVNAPQAAASISTSAPLGKAATWKAARAG